MIARALVPPIALLGVLVVLGCSPEASRESGTETARPAGEPRVISLSPSISGILVALDAADAVVGVDGYSRDIAGLEGVPSLGGLYGPDLERAIELDPSLVLGVKSEQQRAFFDALRRRGVAVHEVDPYTLDEVLETYREIGALLEREAEAEALVARVRSTLDALAARHSGDRPSVVMVVNREPLYVVGGSSFVSELIDVAGGRNVFGDLTAPYPQVSLEALAERAPEVLLDTTIAAIGNAEAREAQAFWSRFGWIGRVELIPAGVATVPGAEVDLGARLIFAALHPEGT